MNTEITKTKDCDAAKGWVFYDGECPVCVGSVARFGGIFARRGFVWLPLQTPDTAARLGMGEAALREEMKLLRADGRVAGGADAWAALLRSVWWLWPLGVLMAVPGLRHLARLGYRWVARNRYCFGGTCPVPGKRPVTRPADWLPLLLLPALAVVSLWNAPAWLMMWATALAIFAGAKWLAWRRVAGHLPGDETTRRRLAFRRTAFLFGWVGMDAAAFLKPASETKPVRSAEVVFAVLKFLLGLALLGLAARLALNGSAGLWTGWLGLFGLIFALHFGAMHLLALAWRAVGVNARPIMAAPLAATSLAEFWGERWNRGFSDLSRVFLFKPLAARRGIAAATLAVFLASGLVHELVISLPARGGWGLPTAYFLLQALGVFVERSGVGRKLGLGRGGRGWLFTVLFAAGPVFWLFHPPFVERVIVPFLKVLTSLGT